MKRIYVALVVMAAVFTFFSCSTTGFMGLASEKAVTEMDEQRTREIGELKTRIERLDLLSEQLEEALAEVEQARTDAAEAVELAGTSGEELADIEKEMEELSDALKKLDKRIQYIPRETIDELIRILEEYSDDNEDVDYIEDVKEDEVDDIETGNRKERS